MHLTLSKSTYDAVSFDAALGVFCWHDRELPCGVRVRSASIMFRYSAPIIFVLIWSTGFIVAKAVTPHADLQLFLLARLTATALVMGLLAMIAGVAWPRGRELGYQFVAGVLLQGVYLCLSYWAITHGMAAGVMALLGALQPLFTALFVASTGKTLASRTWLGLGIGFVGVACVLAPKLVISGTGSLTVASVAAALLSVVGVTIGALFQQWMAKVDLRAASSIQNVGGAAVALLMTMLVGTGEWDGSTVLWGALVWAVLVPSVVGTTLLMWMMRQGDATKVTALILLVPPLASLQAFLFFRETLSAAQLVGFVLALGGVVLARSAPATRSR
jgi:drug/metabolite transporter (DMT)-like permease